tara:strand:+ start:3803 stop:4870 length:1068 start_codon:yes stop_codon:yes gene_type:complete
MFGAVRGLFSRDAGDTAPEQQPSSSTTSDTQDTFSPLGYGDADEVADASANEAASSGVENKSASQELGRGVLRGGRNGSVFASKPLFQDNDDGTDTDGPKRRRPLAPRLQTAVVTPENPIQTLGDAVDHVLDMMNRQIERGNLDGFQLNEPIAGDTATRTSFYTLLPDVQQRVVFIRIAGNMRNWPRIRPLFGAPPYNFLRSEDAGMMRAAGIAHGRANMAHEDSQSAANYNQFGSGQLIDQYDREYRVTPSHNIQLTDPAPWLLDSASNRELILQVRVKKRDKKRKIEMMKDNAARHTLTFPRPGDRVILAPTRIIQSMQRERNGGVQSFALHVQRVVLRSESAATATVLARLV